MFTLPASRYLAIRRARGMDAVKMQAMTGLVFRILAEGYQYLHERPKLVSFASSIASCSVLNVRIVRTGPNISSR